MDGSSSARSSSPVEGFLARRAALHAALGEPLRLAIADELASSDRSPLELRRLLGIESNLLAHHLAVLERVGLIRRTRSAGDARRRYLHLQREALAGIVPGGRLRPVGALFVCTHNAARSQLAAALWQALAGAPAESAGTRPADRVHPGAVAAAARAGLHLGETAPRALAALTELPELVVTVCDRAHEELAHRAGWLHWSIADPAAQGSDAAFDATVDELRARMSTLLSPMEPTR